VSRKIPLSASLAVLAASFAAGLAWAASPATGAIAPCPAMAGKVDVTRAGVPEIREALSAGEVTSRELTETYLARIAALNDTAPKLRAVIMTAPDALEQADAADRARTLGLVASPLAGIPVLIKDNLDTHDMPTTAGAKALLGPPPPTDAYVTAKLRAAGAVLLGKANMSEWATSISERAGLSFSDVGGRLHNPYDGGDTSGSSNGSAIAAAASLATATVGSETQGSIVLPSFINSAAGIKPTRGLVSRGGVVPLIPSFDTPGPIARDLASATELLGPMTGIDPRDPVTRQQRGKAHTDYTQFLDEAALRGARIGVMRNLSTEPTTRIIGRGRIVRTLRKQGARTVPLRERLFVGTAPGKAIFGEFKSSVSRYLRGRGATSRVHSLREVVEFNRRRGRRAVRFGQSFLLDALKATRAEQRSAPRKLARYRVKSLRVINRAFRRHRLDAILVPRITAAVTATSAGLPHVTVPAGYRKRTPFGLVLVGRRFSEPKLIGYGYDFERATRAHRSPAKFNPKYAAVCPR
jgi:amidase